MFEFYNFVDFTGEETEKEFLEKCLEQWDKSINRDISDTNKVLELSTIFREMRHRLDALGGE